MQITKEILEKYARVIVKTGANVQPGQCVNLVANVNQYAFAALVAEECYRAGAKKVDVEWSCDPLSKVHYLYQDTEVMSETLPWEIAKMEQNVKDLPVRMLIMSGDPDALADIAVEKLTAVGRARRQVAKPYRDATDGKEQWVIVALPSPVWAKKVFPDCSEDEAMQKLWDAILTTVRVDEENDPVADWKEHTDLMNAKANWLNEQKFKALHYTSANGTDFTVTLNPEASWNAAGEVNPVNGAYYIPNMPTEEVFTSPLAGSCEGTLVATKPLSYQSQLIEDFSITFADGRAVSWQARKGEELIGQMVAMDENAAKLGEVALVPKESPVNRTGILFYNTLFDENACCHLALGAGFKELLPNGNDLSPEEALAHGVNDSIIHVDFMVGSEDLSIDGIKADGTLVPVFRNGTWA